MADVTIDDKELATLRKAAAAYDAMQPKYADAEKAVGRVKELETTIAGMKSKGVEAAFTAHGIADPKVRKLFELEHAEQAAAEGGVAELGDYLTHLKGLAPDKRPAILSPFLGAGAGAGSGAGAAGAGAAGAGAAGAGSTLPNANKGAVGGPGTQPPLTAEAIEQMPLDAFLAQWGSIRTQIPGLGALPGLPGLADTSNSPKT